MYKVGINPDRLDSGCITILGDDGNRHRFGYGNDFLYRFDSYLPEEAFRRVKLFGRILLWKKRKFHDDRWWPKTEEQAAQVMIYANWLCDAMNAYAVAQWEQQQLAKDAIASLSN